MRVVAHDLSVPRPVLEPDRTRDVALEGVVEIASSDLLVERAERVEVPVVVEEPAAGLDGAARRRTIRGIAEIRGGVIHTRTRTQQVADARGLLDRQQAAIVVEAEGSERRIEIDLAARDRGTISHGDQA